MSWEREAEHMRDYGHTRGPGIDDYVEPTQEEWLELHAKEGAYEKELDVLCVPARGKYVKAGEELKAGLPSSHDITFGNAPVHWREDLSTAEIELCKEASEELGYEFGEFERYPKELKDEFCVMVKRYGFLPGKGGNVHTYAATGIKDPMKCLQLVADFKAIGCNSTTYWWGKKDRSGVGCFISESDTGRLYKEMERWGVSFDKKEALNKEIKQLAAELDQFLYDFDTYGYRDAVSDREYAVAELEQNIRNGNVGHIKDWHNDISLDEHGWDITLESKTLMKWLDNVEKKTPREKEAEKKTGIDERIAGAKKEISEKKDNGKVANQVQEKDIDELPFR